MNAKRPKKPELTPPEMAEQAARRQRLINRKMTYLMTQVDNAMRLGNKRILLDTDAVVTLLDVITDATKVAKEQRRQTEMPVWRRVFEWLKT